MISFLRGRLHSVFGDSLAIDVNGVGYLVQVPASVLEALPSGGSEIMLYTYMAVREDGIKLYGFNGPEALELFQLLLNVNGVGPKAALSLLSACPPAGLAAAIKLGDTGLLTRAPGIGKKIAQRIVLELKDKFKAAGYSDSGSTAAGAEPGDSRSDAVEALVALGFGLPEVNSAVSRAGRELGPGAPSAELVRHALKNLSVR